MARRRIMTKDEIYRRRGLCWEQHYKNRAVARELCAAGWNSVEITMALLQDYPKPELQIDGSMLDVPLEVRQKHEYETLRRFRLSHVHQDLLCVWYWTESGWMEFVRQYQELPDVFEAYYFKYDPEPNDRMLLVPMSSKPKQGSAKKVHVGYVVVDKSVEKAGTSRLQKVQAG